MGPFVIEYGCLFLKGFTGQGIYLKTLPMEVCDL